MDLDFSPKDDEFRAEARTWLEENKPADERPADGRPARDYECAWQGCLFDGGWAGISWPRKWGGRDLSLLQQLIWYEEYAKAEAPWMGVSFVGLNHAGPTLMLRAREDLQARHIPRILRGDEVWCQGFSEPGAGSDLAGVSMKARVDGDELVVNGQKIWTSFADVSDFQELLVRTSTGPSRHKGITWVVCDMSSPGIEVRPIRNIAGNEELCEVFYDDVRIPLSNVVGDIDDGWSVAMSTLSFERGTAFMADIVELSLRVERLIEAAKTAPGPIGQASAYDDDWVRGELAQLRAELAALRALNYATVSRIARAGRPGPEGSIVRFYFAQLNQRASALGMEILGATTVAADRTSPWTVGFANSFRSSIAAGTKDIQRNIIGERLLGLPKDR